MKFYASKNLLILNVIWTKIAAEKAEEINQYLILNFGEKTAEEFRLKLFSAANLISQNHNIGKRINSKTRGFVVVRQISIIYAVSSDIEILTLWDNRQKPIW